MTYYRWKRRYGETLLAATLRVQKVEKENGLMEQIAGRKCIPVQWDKGKEHPAIDPIHESARISVLMEENARLKCVVIEQALAIQRIREASSIRRVVPLKLLNEPNK